MIANAWVQLGRQDPTEQQAELTFRYYGVSIFDKKSITNKKEKKKQAG